MFFKWFDDFSIFMNSFNCKIVVSVIIVFMNDNILSYVNKMMSKVIGIGCFKGCIGKIFMCIMGRNEVF